jgi:hypothetical protein
MATTITINLDDLEEKCMRFVAASPQDFIQNLVDSRVFAAKQEIYQMEVRRMTEDPSVTNIPADVDAVVSAAEVTYADVEPELPEV